jgi:hypothetical protein
MVVIISNYPTEKYSKFIPLVYEDEAARRRLLMLWCGVHLHSHGHGQC